MNQNPLKTKLANGQTVIGPYIQEFYTAGLPGIVAASGADFLIFDYEHSGWTSETLRTQIALARGAGLVPIVNSPGEKYEREGLLLDMGAMGLMVPHIRTADQCSCLVRATRYPPQGSRGGAFGIAHDSYSHADIPRTIVDANDSVLLIAKLESAEAIRNAEAIMAVPGIDVALVTSFDLALDMGLGGEVTHPEILRAQEHVLRVCEQTGKIAACAAFDVPTGLKRLSEGYRFIQYSWDIGLFQDSLAAGIRALREQN
jgi:2-keto-3-deoxy-L-rhamnonate aldolase RhmA